MRLRGSGQAAHWGSALPWSREKSFVLLQEPSQTSQIQHVAHLRVEPAGERLELPDADLLYHVRICMPEAGSEHSDDTQIMSTRREEMFSCEGDLLECG